MTLALLIDLNTNIKSYIPPLLTDVLDFF